MTTHDLKTWVPYYLAIHVDAKRFEYRLNDRDYQRGDILRLQAYDPELKAYLSKKIFPDIICEVTYILKDLPDGYCVMSIKKLEKENES